MADRELVDQLRHAIEEDLVGSIETHQGECCVRLGGTDKGYKWRGGEAEVRVPHWDDDGEFSSIGDDVTYVFGVQVVLLHAET